MPLPAHKWMRLSPLTKRALINMFHLKPSGFTHVINNKLEKDGFTDIDLEKITTEEISYITHLQSNNFDEQFEVLLKMLEQEEDYLELNPERVETLQQHVKANQEVSPDSSTNAGTTGRGEKKKKTS